MIIELLRGILKPDALCASFMSALDQIDRLSVSSAVALRRPLGRIVAANLDLMQRNFRRHSVGELATSQTLQGIAATMKPIALRDELVTHARDEMRHSKMFAALANELARTTGREDREDYGWVLENDRKFVERYNGDVILFICDVLASEVRTYSFVSSYVEALDENGSDLARRAAKVLRRILQDECRHVGYTARYISGWMSDGLDLSAPLRRSFENFDRNSWVEVAATAQFLYRRT